MTAVTALIADDEPLLREVLRSLLARHWPELQLVAGHHQRAPGQRAGRVARLARHAQHQPRARREQRRLARTVHQLDRVHRRERILGQRRQRRAQGLRQRPVVVARQRAAVQREGQVEHRAHGVHLSGA
jgi:hypothetical protein